MDDKKVTIVNIFQQIASLDIEADPKDIDEEVMDLISNELYEPFLEFFSKIKEDYNSIKSIHFDKDNVPHFWVQYID